jgi:hypothetical protein
MSPQTVSFDGYIASRAALGAFKHCVFDKVTDSVEFRSLVPGTSAHPDAGGYRSEPGHVFSQDSDPVREFCGLHFVYHLLEIKQCVKAPWVKWGEES